MKVVRITISGKVQGVAFRYYTKMKADELGIDGSVQNLENGSVFVLAKGNSKELDIFINWCNEGSPASHVNEVIVEYDKTVKPTVNKAASKTKGPKFVILKH